MPESFLPIDGLILKVRGLRVIADADLAQLYGVSTKHFNQAFKRNQQRFPSDFAFQLKAAEAREVAITRSTAPKRAHVSEFDEFLRSQFVTSKTETRGGRRTRPWVFTEHGAIMAANILRSKRAIDMAVFVVRAFVKQREALATNLAILKRLAEIDKTLIEHDSALQIVWRKIQPLLTPPPEKPKRRIGFIPEATKQKS